jgi:RNA polymerase sigma-70 factor (ECF subfamily)
MDAILAAGRRVVGIDQSTGMLEQARLKHPSAEVVQLGLQELAFRHAFDAAVCIDAMEYVPPDDWPVVLSNLRRAVRRAGLVYLTVEEIDRAEVDRAYAEALQAGLPVVWGEHHQRGGGYHFYPMRKQVTAWLAKAGLDVVAEDASQGTNYAYWHLLLRRIETGASVHDDVVAAAWTAHRDELTAFVVRSTRDRELAEDILQDAYLRLLREVRAGRPPRSVRAWLYRAAGNLVIDRGRRQASTRRCLDRVSAATDPVTPFDPPADAALEREAARERLRALEGLDPRARRALLLAAEGLRGKEVAQEIGCSHVAARALLHRARVQARACLSA